MKSSHHKPWLVLEVLKQQHIFKLRSALTVDCWLVWIEIVLDENNDDFLFKIQCDEKFCDFLRKKKFQKEMKNYKKLSEEEEQKFRLRLVFKVKLGSKFFLDCKQWKLAFGRWCCWIHCCLLLSTYSSSEDITFYYNKTKSKSHLLYWTCNELKNLKAWWHVPRSLVHSKCLAMASAKQRKSRQG